PCTVGPGVLAVSACVLDTHGNRVRDFARARRAPIATHIRDDQGTVAKPWLRAMVLPDSDALGEPQYLSEPDYCLPHITVDQYGNDSRLRHRPVPFHFVSPPQPWSCSGRPISQ